MEYRLKNNDLAILYNRRHDIKREIDNFNQFFDNLVTKYTNLVGILEIKARLISINQYWSMFEEIQKEIEDKDNETEDDKCRHKKDRDDFEHIYFETIANSVLYLEQFIAKKPILTASDHACLADIQLPGITLTKFSGDGETPWISFYNSFKTLIHYNNELDEFKKLCYLKISLTGNAALMVTDHKINDYKAVWDLLEETYSKELKLLANYAKSLYELPKIEQFSIDALKQLWDIVKLYIEKLESLQKHSYYNNSLLVPVIVSKFDQYTAKEWTKKMENNCLPTVQEIEEFFKEITEQIKQNPTSTGLELCPKKNEQETSCYLCHDRQHSLIECLQFLQLPPKLRYNFVRSVPLCTNCLRRGHASVFCTTKFNCKICRRNHNTLLHFFNLNYTENAPIMRMYCVQRMNSQQDQLIAFQFIQSPMYALTYTNLYFCGDFVNTFLATARVNVQDVFGQTHYCRVFLNSSSHANYITESLARNLFVNRGYTFLGTQQIVNISASTINNFFKEDLKVLVVPEITNIIVPNLPIDAQKLNIPSYITMADPYYYQPAGFDILIGAEKFYSLLLPPKLKLQVDIELQDSMLGWIITGRIPEDCIIKYQ